MRQFLSPPAARKPSLLSLLSIAVLAAIGSAQAPADASAAKGAGAAQGSPTPAEDVTAGLPKFLQMVPGGKVEVGLTIDELAAAASQVVSPARPEMAIKMSEEKVKTAMRRSASLLGHTSVDVQPFLLGRWNVKNSEYVVYVEHMRQLQKKVRVPFHWWRFGRADDYNGKLEAINKEFPKDKIGPLNFWDRYGHELPFALKTEKGESIADLPVTYVSFAEANAFAGWLGMRLPTEYEWLRAARGDQKSLWPGGAEAFSDAVLKALQQYNSRDQVLKPTGSVASATGPFGHVDMYGQVWQFVADLGYEPLSGKDAFEAEWKKVAKHKVGNLLDNKPVWKGNVALAKGGSYLSFQEPIQLMLDTRAPVGTIDVMESLSFRLAKSLRPGYDMLFSLLRGPFNKGLLAEGQDFDLSLQVGGERYELGADGFPTAYHAVSFAPVNWLSADKSVDLTKLMERAQVSPILIGTLATTEPMLEPSIPAGHYSVQFRREGMPRELTDAIKVGHKEIQAELKRKKKDGDKKDGDAQEETKRGPWAEVIARFGITEKDLAEAEHASSIKFVRIDGVQISTEADAFLLSGLEGKVIGVLPGTNKKPAQGNAFAPETEIAADAKGKTTCKMRIGMPLKVQDPKKFADMQIVLTLDTPAPTAEKPWRVQTAK